MRARACSDLAPYVLIMVHLLMDYIHLEHYSIILVQAHKTLGAR